VRFNEAISGWRFFRQWRDRPDRPVVRVRTRLHARENDPTRRSAMVVLAVVGACVAALLLWLGVRALGGVLFSRNDRFTLRRLAVTEGELITADLVREYTQLQEGTNLFAISIGQIRDDFLRKVPCVKALEIRRMLPDTLEIKVTERVPLARVVGRNRALAADGEGHLFAVGAGYRDLPVITGYAEDVRPGRRIQGLAGAALVLLSMCDSPKIGLRVTSVDIGPENYLLLKLADGTLVKFNWEKMGEDTVESRGNLWRKLGRLARARQSAQGRQHRSFDFTYSDMVVGQ
jgi:cell division septal protein FtsQ